jgi:hypothetical protein
VNYVYLSPHFPPGYYRFCVGLRRAGANVLGLAEAPWDALRPELRDALGEYYRVADMEDYDQLLRALGHFTHRHGRIGGIDSLNEHWLEAEARLRTDFNVDGIRADRIADVKRKSRMKEIYRAAGVPVARGAVARDLAAARALAAEVGFPLVAKPDVGVGASATWRIDGEAELEAFYGRKPPADYILEEYVRGRIVSFDGLADRSGRLVFWTSHVYSQGIMETVNADDHVYYYSLRQVPPDLEEAGRRTVRAFGVRGRFFHLEFFRAEPDDRLVALEVNMRPPGGLTTDMFNYANDIDIYDQWASVVVRDRFDAAWSRPYFCCYAGRKRTKRYARSHEEVLSALRPILVHEEAIDGVFRGAIGDHGYVFRSPREEEILEAARLVHELA